MWEVGTIVGELFEEKRRCKIILENRKQMVYDAWGC